MEKVTYTYTRQHLSSIDQLINDSETFCIERKHGKGVFMVEKESYDSLLETSYLLRSPQNANKLFEASEQSNKGLGTKIDL